MPKSGRQPEKGLTDRVCVVCGKTFQPYRDYQVACSRSCRERGPGNPLAIDWPLACRRCGQEFVARWSGMGSQPQCKDCTNEVERQSQARKNVARRIETNPARRGVNLRQNLRRYGVTVEQYEAMLSSQGGGCAICGSPADPQGVRSASRLHVDHDHVTGLNRALLCIRCNQGIGYFLDDPARLRTAAAYIERHRKDQNASQTDRPSDGHTGWRGLARPG